MHFILLLLSTALISEAALLKRDLVIQTLDGWASLGCWTDSQSSRTLSVAAHFGQHVSDTNCQYQCQQLGYAFAGTEYSGQCYCDNYVNSASTQAAQSDCNMACTGDSTQPCGGSNRINLFSKDGDVATPPPSTTPATSPGSVDGWVSQGCYTDSTGARGLAHGVATAGGQSVMTIASCVDACKAAGYSLSGVEYADECYCDNAIQNGQALASDQTTCNMACKGNASTICGGSARMNLYSYGGATPAVAPQSSSSAVPTVAPTLAAGWTSLGCYTDNTNGQRALGNFIPQPSSGMTVEFCVNSCAAQGWTVAGVEYGGECYCDHSVAVNAGQAGDGNAQCNMACSGNAGETCGGPNRLNLYAAGPGWVRLGCYTDQVYQRTLITGSTSPNNTIESCQVICLSSGYSYGGMEYSNECHCGNAFLNGGGPAPDNSAGCSFTCAGNSSELCGGSNRLTMFAYIQANGTIITNNQPQASATTTASSTGPTAQTTGLPSGWAYSNCYVDQAHGRILTHQQPDSSSLTASRCIGACSAAGYSVAGLEYSSQCFCDNALQNGATTAPGQCAMTCSGDSTKTCGGPNLVDVYSNGPLTSASQPTTQTTNLPGNWTYAGCLTDSVGNRVFPVEQDMSNASATSCIAVCANQGYSVAGIEYADQCFCGNQAQLKAASSSPSTQCNMVCSGDSTHICGGPNAVTVYSAGGAN